MKLGGGISIDISQVVRIFSITRSVIPAASLVVGHRIEASVQLPSDPNSPLTAKVLFAQLDDEGFISAPVQSVDLATQSLVVANQQVLINDQTKFAILGGARSLGEVKVGKTATVIYRVEGTNLVAADVQQLRRRTQEVPFPGE